MEKTLYIPTGDGDPHAEREDELLREMKTDLFISRQFVANLMPGSDLYNFHKARMTYLKTLVPIDSNHKSLVE